MSKLTFLYGGLFLVVWAVACSGEEAATGNASEPESLGLLSSPLVADAADDGGSTSDAQ